MMCSNWKISVFGIVALMLAFGLATTRCRGTAEPSGPKHRNSKLYHLMVPPYVPLKRAAL